LHASFEKTGMGFTVLQRDRDELRFRRHLASSLRFYSAFVIQGSLADEWLITELHKQHIPFVVLEGSGMQGNITQVGTPYDKGMELVINHVYQSGYRNLGMLIPAKEKNNQSHLLANYFCGQVKKRAGLRNAGVIEADLFPEPPADLKDRLLSLLRPPTSMQAIILTEVSQVIPFYSLLNDLKIRLPYDLALLCCEDDASLELLVPPVTALRKPIGEMAAEITRLLWEEIGYKRKKTTREKVFLEPFLQLRKSCGTI
jgi:LacI family transcriptional regulator